MQLEPFVRYLNNFVSEILSPRLSMQALLHIAKFVSGNRTTESWLEATVVKRRPPRDPYGAASP